MKIRKLAVAGLAVAGLGAASTASAQNWGGFYVDGALGARGNSTEVNFTSNTVPPTIVDSGTNDFGNTNFLASFSGGWRWAGAAVVGFGAFIDWAGTDAGQSSSSTFVPGPGGGTFTDVTEVKQSSRYGLSIDVGPNWRTHPYAKLTYAWGKFELNETITPALPAGCTMPSSVSGTHGGWGLGAGVRHLQTNNLYMFAEVLWQDFGSKSHTITTTCNGVAVANTSVTVNPTNVIGTIGVGWKF